MNDEGYPGSGELTDVEVEVVADLTDEPHRSKEVFDIIEPLFDRGNHGVTHVQH